MARNSKRVSEEPGLPVEVVPPGCGQPESLESMLQRMVRGALSRDAEAKGFDSFEDADDFEEEDPDVISLTHHEVAAMTDEELRDEATSLGYTLTDGEAPQESKAIEMAPDEDEGTGSAPAPAQRLEDPQEEISG